MLLSIECSMRANAASTTSITATPPLRMMSGTWRAELLPRSAYHAAYTAATLVIGFAFESQSGVHAFASDRKLDFRARPNSLAYVPAGCDVYSVSDHGGEYLKIAVDCKGKDDWPGPRRFSDAIDAIAIEAARRLRRELLSKDCTDELECERFVQALKERAACILHAPLPERSAASWMTPQRLRRIDELVEERLDTKLTVEELANALQLSAGFFSRAFAAAIGQAPHDYIIDRRVSRARALLRSTALDLGAIAQASGFSSHAHMTATFRKRLGVSPRALRLNSG
jgi:AraC family transcriptional regulator